MDSKDITAIFAEWEQHFAPPRFLPTDKNARLLTEYLLDQGTISITAISAAVKALEGALDWEREKTPREIFLEAQAKENARLRRDQLENRPIAPKEYKEPTTNTFDPKEIARRTEQEKKDLASQRQIGELIKSYLPIKDGRIDYALQSREAEKMRLAVQKHVKNGESFQNIAKMVAAKIAELYETAEKAQEKSTSWLRG